MVALCMVGRGSIPGRVIPKLEKNMVHNISLLSIEHFGKKHGSETVLLDSQLPAVAFTVLAQLCGSWANETEMGAALFTKIVREGTYNIRKLSLG